MKFYYYVSSIYKYENVVDKLQLKKTDTLCYNYIYR